MYAGMLQESLAAGTALSEDVATGNLAARMAAVGCMHELAIMAGLARPGREDASAAALPSLAVAASKCPQPSFACLVMMCLIGYQADS